MLRRKPQFLAIGACIPSVRCAVVGLLALACLAVPPAKAAQDRSQGRSMVISRGGIVAAESPLAAQAGATVLAHGGNAIDAIVATNAAMGVVEPMMNGMGGDLFAIVYDRQDGQAVWPECQRLGAREAHYRVSEGQGHHDACPSSASTP